MLFAIAPRLGYDGGGSAVLTLRGKWAEPREERPAQAEAGERGAHTRQRSGAERTEP